MFHSQGPSKHTCSLLAVTCGKVSESKRKEDVPENRPQFPFPELISSGRLEVKNSFSYDFYIALACIYICVCVCLFLVYKLG